jgi:hypothetical protein
MTKIYGYIQNKQSEAILWYGSMTQETAEHFLTSRGLSVSDHTIVLDATDIDVQAMMDTYSESLKTYSDHRASSYPSIPDQLDMLWHAMDTGILPKVDSFYSINKSVKDKYPKE